MTLIWTPNGAYRRTSYLSEADLETAILQVQSDLFGPNRIYLDIKKKIGLRGVKQNIPDGYLIDLNGKTPTLYVVENELASHDLLRHIAMQLLEFSLSFKSDRRTVKSILYSALNDQPAAKAACEQYAQTHGLRNLDNMLDCLVHDSPFAVLVIIDEIPEMLENQLAREFNFGVELVQLVRYQNAQGERMYHFEPFLADVNVDAVSVRDTKVPITRIRNLDTREIDTVVVPAREDGFQRSFIGNNRWFAISIHGTIRPQIKYIAAYRIRPIQAITHIATVASIEPWQDSGKYVLNFSAPAEEIGPIPLAKDGRVKPLQNLRYTTRANLEKARTLDDLW